MKAAKPYKVHHDDGQWNLVEQPTDQVIRQYDDSRTAKRQANFLNGGNGFNSWTPPFFLRGI